MVQSVELLLDDVTDALVRQEWRRLLDADLPSQARHTGRSNRPHITLAVARTLSASQEAALSGLADPLPLSLVLGAPLLFGSGPFVLARMVLPTAQLLELQAAAAAAMDEVAAPFARQQAPGRWTGHVTLARKLRAEDLPRALEILVPLSDLDAHAVSVRRWDGDRKVEWPILPRSVE